MFLATLALAVLVGVFLKAHGAESDSPAFPVIKACLRNFYDRVSGPGEAGGSSDPSLAVFNDPSSICVDAGGRIYFSERRRHLVRCIDNGVLRTIAGNGRAGFSGDGMAAIRARLSYPEGLALDRHGNLLVADSGNHRVRMISTDGRISTVAGIGVPGYSGDGGQALSARLNAPMDVGIGPHGDIFIADWGNHRIRKVSPSGRISTVAGNGKAGFSGDGGAAEAAMLSGPYGIGIGRNGNLYIADSGNHRVRRVTCDGRIRTVAGTGAAGFSGDGGPGVLAALNSPQAIHVSRKGAVFINDEHNHRVRRLDPDGSLRTVAGNGETGMCGDGGAASKACLYDPEDIWLDRFDALYIADGDNHRLRKISADGVIVTIAGSGPIGKKK